jgi:hypothetical protein
MLAALIWIPMFGGWAYFIYICLLFKAYGVAFVGMFTGPLASLIGLWSLLFGVPGWFLNLLT